MRESSLFRVNKGISLSIVEPDRPSDWEGGHPNGDNPRVFAARPALGAEGFNELHSTDPRRGDDGASERPAENAEPMERQESNEQESVEQESVKMSASVGLPRHRLSGEAKTPVIAHRLVEKRRHSERRKIKHRVWLGIGYVVAGVVVAVLSRQIYLNWY